MIMVIEMLAFCICIVISDQREVSQMFMFLVINFVSVW